MHPVGPCSSLAGPPSVLAGSCALWGLDPLKASAPLGDVTLSVPHIPPGPVLQSEALGVPQPSPLRSPWAGSQATRSELLLGFSADFKSNLQKVYQAIEEADFFAIDGEFSGIPRSQA